MDATTAKPGRRIAVIGGGFSGALFALKAAQAHPDWRILLIEGRTPLGRGVAYGDCAPYHMLNVPVARMEVGLSPGFSEWLRRDPGVAAGLAGGGKANLDDAFVPRILFGDYLEEQVTLALRGPGQSGIHRIHGRAADVVGMPAPGVLLADGRHVAADAIVLAMGNEPPHIPFPVTRHPLHAARVIADPWARGALDPIGPNDAVLLCGTGLTMVDMALKLQAKVHRGRLHAISRHGLLPLAHKAGGAWPAFIDTGWPPLAALRQIRAAVARAQAVGIPWQRVFDAARPAVAALWNSWSLGQRAQFLRHLRAVWDIHRHRLAPQVAAAIQALRDTGQLTVMAGHVAAADETETGVSVALRHRRRGLSVLDVGYVVNCTGPNTDLERSRQPLIRRMLDRKLIQRDPLRLGIRTNGTELPGCEGWLHALGPVTRAAWWEIVAVPEINAQIDHLVRVLGNQQQGIARRLPEIFLDIGAGI